MIVFNNANHGHDIAAAAGTAFNAHTDVCIARVENGELWGGVTYTAYTGASIGLHIAGFRPDWVSRDMIWVCFNYPFVQLGCSKLFGQVPASNRKALEFDLKLGFIEEARVKDVFPDGDLIVIAMKREDCRWLKLKPRSLKEHV
jgi:RimJ/RimL family protein N-acetyltransferase